MIQVQASSVIDAPIDRVWAIVRDFSAIGDWLPGVEGRQIEGDDRPDRIGVSRRVAMGEGDFIRDRLLGLSDVDHRVDFSIIESQLPISDYQTRIQLLPVSDGDRTFIIWSGHFDSPPEHAAEMKARMPRSGRASDRPVARDG